jgi:hypothetical protein
MKNKYFKNYESYTMIFSVIPKIIKQTLIFEFTYQKNLSTINLK